MKSTCLSLAFGLAALASTPAPGNAVIEAVFKTAEVLDSKNWTEGEPHLRAQRSSSPLYLCGEAGLHRRNVARVALEPADPMVPAGS